MGQKQPKPEPPKPEPTVKELVKEFTKGINKNIREFDRTTNELKFNNNKIRNELKRMAKNNESRANMRIVAKGLAQNNNYLKKYALLKAQLQNITFQLQSIQVNDTMVNVMKQMTSIMQKGEKNFDLKTMQKTMQEFMMQMEKQGIMSEQINDMMADGDDMEDDNADLDRIIDQVESEGKGGQKIEAVNKDDSELDRIEEQIKKL